MPSAPPAHYTEDGRQPGRRRVYSGFTLVELLVVIAIISLLMGIVLPSLSAARDTAKAMHCSVNLRSIGQALQMYADENNETYPYTTGWQVWEGDGTGDDQPLRGWTEQMRDYMTSQEVYIDKARPMTPYSYFLQGAYPKALLRRQGIEPTPGQPLSMRAPSIFFTSQFVMGGDNMNPIMFPEPYGVALGAPPNCDMDDAEFECAFVGGDDRMKPHKGTVNLLYQDGHAGGTKTFDEGRMTWDGRELRTWRQTQDQPLVPRE
jgi:prepilin-type N-terminal cleavage/methylation domain-containing protein/prepilin-type processing-associated H-X9-DG protein